MPQAHPPTVTRTKRSIREGSHGLPAALSPLVTPSTPAVWTHVAGSGPLLWRLPTTRLAHTPAGCGHGGTRNISTSRSLHTRSVTPAPTAGVWGPPCLPTPAPLAAPGCATPGHRLAAVNP